MRVGVGYFFVGGVFFFSSFCRLFFLFWCMFGLFVPYLFVFIHLFFDLFFFHLFIFLFIYLFIYLLTIYLFIYLFMYLFIFIYYLSKVKKTLKIVRKK